MKGTIDLKKQNKPSKAAIVWTILVLVTILVLSTSGVLASILISTGSENHNIIALTPGDAEESNGIFEVKYRPVTPENDVEIGSSDTNAEEQESAWSAQTSIDLFNDCYYNEKGELTVKSADGRPIVAPGTSGQYPFSIKNTGNTVLNSTIKLSGASAMFGDKIPFKIRLLQNGEWVIGSDSEWCSAKSLDDFSKTLSVKVGECIEYILEWMWAYEDEVNESATDFIDSEIGTASIEPGNVFALKIETLSEEIPGAVAVDENGNPLYEELIAPSTSNWIILLLFLAILCAALLIAMIFGPVRFAIAGLTEKILNLKDRKRIKS